MEPNKVEKQIREKLNAREINPSVSSWDRLDAMLSVAENKKPKRNFRWLFVAAGIVGFVFVGLFLRDQKDTNLDIKNNQTVVESNIDAEKGKGVKEQIFQTEAQNQSIKDKAGIKSTEVAAISTAASAKIKKEQHKTVPSVNPESNNQESIAEVIPQNTEEKPKETSNTATLLATSDSNTSEKTGLSKPKLKINANALLSQVDGEIELTFRQKTIKTITKKFESAREAIVSRNQE